MKCFLFVIILVFVSGGTRSQEIKKIKIEELVNYIRDCDHPLIVNFWATYCDPCVKEIPYLQSEVAKYKDQKLELLLVSLDPHKFFPTKIEQFVKDHHLVDSVYWLDEKNADYFCPKIDKQWTGGIPSSLFVNNATHYRKFFERQLTEPQVLENISLLIKQ